jgi:hypothetical protein
VGAWVHYLYRYRWVFGGEVPASEGNAPAAAIYSRGAPTGSVPAAHGSGAHEEENHGSTP